jgi:hypothetical protein
MREALLCSQHQASPNLRLPASPYGTVQTFFVLPLAYVPLVMGYHGLLVVAAGLYGLAFGTGQNHLSPLAT